MLLARVTGRVGFQSTLPAKGATSVGVKRRTPTAGFNPRSPRRERRRLSELSLRSWVFQSTLPAKGATWVPGVLASKRQVSIHAPREGSDQRLRPSLVSTSVSIHAPREGSDKPSDADGDTVNCFNPRSPRRERHAGFRAKLVYIWFQSTLPAKGATPWVVVCLRIAHVSIHAPREGSDHGYGGRFAAAREFQSTLPAKGATGVIALADKQAQVSIHAPREGSDHARWRGRSDWRVSIHAPREGSDACPAGRNALHMGFNPRSPRRERHDARPVAPLAPRFNPRSPRRERRVHRSRLDGHKHVSIHAPREGSDRRDSGCGAGGDWFQSTLPAKGATCSVQAPDLCIGVSIHAPREGSDFWKVTPSAASMPFQSTLPAKGATCDVARGDARGVVSIHAPREGSDLPAVRAITANVLFQSTLPAKGATTIGAHDLDAIWFQSTLPAKGATCPPGQRHICQVCFNPRSPRRERPAPH